VESSFTSTQLGAGGGLSLEIGGAGGGTCMRADIPAQGGVAPPSDRAAAATIMLPTIANNLHVELDMRLDLFDPSSVADTLVRAIVVGVGGNEVSIEVRDPYITDWALLLGDGSTLPLRKWPVAGVWTHLTIDIDLSQTTTISILLDGAVALPKSTMFGQWGSGPGSLTIGLQRPEKTANAWAISYDNVFVGGR
jgi:hypothetical protein